MIVFGLNCSPVHIELDIWRSISWTTDGIRKQDDKFHYRNQTGVIDQEAETLVQSVEGRDRGA